MASAAEADLPPVPGVCGATGFWLPHSSLSESLQTSEVGDHADEWSALGAIGAIHTSRSWMETDLGASV